MNLTINYNSKDLSRELEDYSGPGKAIGLEVGKKLYIGYHKPIESIYVELKTKVKSEAILKVEVDTDAGLQEALVYDMTYGLSNSGRLSWQTDKKKQIKFTRLGKELYWVAISTNENITERQFIGINTIFSYDTDLEEEYPNIIAFLPEDDSGVKAQSFIKFHMSARKEIVQFLRKKNLMDAKLLDQFDLLNIEEVHQASKYLTLHKIFFWLADTVDDKWRIKSKEFYNTYADFVDAVTLSVDSNDNGIADIKESNAIHSIRLIRE